MSDQQRVTGTLRKLQFNDKFTMEQHCENIIKGAGREKESYHDTYVDAVADEFSDDYFFYKGQMYSLEKKDEDPYESFIEMEQMPDGNIKFHTSFYNGGTCLSEMLGDGLKRINPIQPTL